MHRFHVRTAGLLAVFALCASTSAHAQEGPGPAVSISFGARGYDIGDSEGRAVLAAIRSDFYIRPGIILEIAGSVADPPADRPERAATSVLEAQLQTEAALGRLAPYAGAGIGLARTRAADDETGSAAVVSVGAGVRYALSYQLGLVADVRARGLGFAFEDDHLDVTLGFRWRWSRR
jgi:hypothetical protein